MPRLVVQYGRPTDPAAFDRHLREVHHVAAFATGGASMASFDPDDVSPTG